MLKIKDIGSLLEMTKALLLNGYKVTITTIYEDFPREQHISCFELNYTMEFEIEKEGNE